MKQKAPRENMPADACTPVMGICQGSNSSFICLPSAITRHGSSSSFLGTKPRGIRFCGSAPGGHHSRAPEMRYFAIILNNKGLSSSTDRKFGRMTGVIPPGFAGK